MEMFRRVMNNRSVIWNVAKEGIEQYLRDGPLNTVSLSVTVATWQGRPISLQQALNYLLSELE